MSVSAATLVVHAGGVRRTLQDLAHLPTPSATKTWRPIPHHELVGQLHDSLAAVGVDVVHESYCTMGRDDAKVLGSLDLRIPDLDTREFRMGLGLRASNDRSVAIQFVAAARVFVCDNWCFSGQGGAVFLKRKHTSGLQIGREIPAAIGGFLEKAGTFRADLNRMQGREIADDRAKLVIYDAFAAGILPCRLLDDVHHLYFDDHEQRDKFPSRILWGLNNAFTEAVKSLGLARQHSAGLAVGRLFGRLAHEPDRPDRVTIEVPAIVSAEPEPEPIAQAEPAPRHDWDLLVDFHD